METIEVLHWKSKTTPDLELYTVDSPSEITVIVFEPSSLSWNDFFVGPEIKGKLETSRQHIEEALNGVKTQKQSVSITPIPQSAPHPSATATSAVAMEKPSSGFPIVPVVILLAVVTSAVVLFARRKSQ